MNQNHYSLVIPNCDFDNKIQNEDFHYLRLMAGFLISPNGKDLSIS